MDDQISARVAELRKQRDGATRRLAEREQEQRQAAADPAAYHEAGQGIARERAEHERLTLLVQTAEAKLREEQLAAQTAAKRTQLAAALKACEEAMESMPMLAAAYAEAQGSAWRARKNFERAEHVVDEQRRRARKLAKDLGEPLNFNNRDLEYLQHLTLERTHTLHELHERARCFIHRMRPLLRHRARVTAEMYPVEQQLEDALAGRYLAQLEAFKTGAGSLRAPAKAEPTDVGGFYPGISSVGDPV